MRARLARAPRRVRLLLFTTLASVGTFVLIVGFLSTVLLTESPIPFALMAAGAALLGAAVLVLTTEKVWGELASEAGLRATSATGPFQGGCAVGAIDGFPVDVGGDRRNETNGILFYVRFKAESLSVTGDELRERIATSPDMLAAMAKNSLSGAEKKALTVGADSVGVLWQYSLRTPSAERTARALRAIVATVKAAAQPVGADCEVCGDRAGDLYLVNGRDLRRLCVGDLRKMEAADDTLAEAYRALPSRPLTGLLFGTAAAIVAALIWAGVALVLHRIFVYVAFLIGTVIGFAIARGAAKIDLFSQIATVVLTFIAVILGQFVYVVVSVASAAGIPISVDLVRRVADRFVAVEFAGASGYTVLVFALLGALAMLWVFRPPRLRRQFVLVMPSELTPVAAP